MSTKSVVLYQWPVYGKYSLKECVMNVTCADYRLERRLLALKQMLNQKDLEPKERDSIAKEIAELEQVLGMD
jgi:hypothetical protein